MLGNDVIDLLDPESFASTLHPRFDARVFSTQELTTLEQSANPNEQRWSLWAAKESAYKLLRRKEKIIFSPSKFCVHLDARGAGTVQYEKLVLPVRVSRASWFSNTGLSSALHAICTTPGLAPKAWIFATAESATLQQDCESSLTPSAAVRRLAAQVVARALALDPTLLCVRQEISRVPYFEYAGEKLPISLSLAHHGRFVAFACTRPQEALAYGRAA